MTTGRVGTLGGMTHLQAGAIVVEVGILAVAALGALLKKL